MGVGASRAWHESGRYGAAAHLIEVTALPLSPSHSLVMPSVVCRMCRLMWPLMPIPQSWLAPNLRARVRVGVGANGAWHKSGRYSAAAHSSEVMALPLSPSHSLVMPSVV